MRYCAITAMLHNDFVYHKQAYRAFASTKTQNPAGNHLVWWLVSNMCSNKWSAAFFVCGSIWGYTLFVFSESILKSGGI